MSPFHFISFRFVSIGFVFPYISFLSQGGARRLGNEKKMQATSEAHHKALLESEAIRASQRMREAQRITEMDAREEAAMMQERKEHQLQELMREEARCAAVDAASSASAAGPRAADEKTETEEVDLPRPDWAAYYAGTPLNVMDAAARKAVQRISVPRPRWEEWRADSLAEGKALASGWGARDRNTRVVSAGGGAWGDVLPQPASEVARADGAVST